jgi:hypothetical protein
MQANRASKTAMPRIENGLREFEPTLVQLEDVRLRRCAIRLDASLPRLPATLARNLSPCHHRRKHRHKQQRWSEDHRCVNQIVPQHGLVPRFNLRRDDADVRHVGRVAHADHLRDRPEVQVRIALHKHHLLLPS